MYHKTRLKNGLRIVMEEIPEVRSAAVGIWVKVGSGNEKPESNGFSHFTEHMIFKGTQKRDMAEIAQIMDSLGGQMGAFTGRELTCYYAKVLDKHLPQAVELLADILYNSVFAPQEIEREKKVVLEEIKMYEDSPDELIHDIFTQDIWNNHPLGQSILGRKEVIGSLQQERLIDFWQTHYTPEEIVISIAGNINFKETTQLIQNSFDRKGKVSGPKFDSDAPTLTPNLTSRHRDLEQIHLCLGTLGLTVTDEDRFALKILGSIVGGGMSSRLFQEIREKRALAYDVHSYSTAYQKAGLFVVYVGTSACHYQEVVKVILEEFVNLKAKKIKEDELKRAKERIKGKLVLALEDSTYRMSRLAEQELNFGRFFSVDEVLEKVEQVTSADVQQVARKIFLSDYLTLSSLGPLTQEEAEGVILKC